MAKIGKGTVKELAERVVEQAGQAGGYPEIKRLAEKGWPQNRPLTPELPGLRGEIRRIAREIVRDEESA